MQMGEDFGILMTVSQKPTMIFQQSFCQLTQLIK